MSITLSIPSLQAADNRPKCDLLPLPNIPLEQHVANTLLTINCEKPTYHALGEQLHEVFSLAWGLLMGQSRRGL